MQVMEILFLSVALLDAQKIALSENYSERPRPIKNVQIINQRQHIPAGDPENIK